MSSDYRYEIKFVLDNSRLSDAMQWLYNETTAIKTYDNRKVNSIYFDDVGFSSVRDNLAGISQRNKLRLRWYGEQKHTLPIFEVKTKNGRLGCKTTYPIQSIENSLMKLNIDKITSKCISGLEEQNIVFDEHLVPTLQVNYEREYYETHDSIRITIDQNIQFSDTQLHTTLDENNSFPYPFSVMEIKFKPSMKNTVAKLIKPLHITPKRHSKYLVGLAVLGYAVYI
jgi:SPX domain protein involved in polyphosphate accumulation|tara:strand:- start:130 stop:807 length:678 start_codon:yes stop_codon:yes gene_type:complete